MSPTKRLLFLNRSFYPDLEATGQLLTELCQAMEEDFEVHVICGNPLYQRIRQRGLINKSHLGKITIWRINNTTLPKRFFLTRVVNLLSYFILCFFWAFCLPRMDCVIAETDPPLLASIAYIYSRVRRSVFIYYSQDIWPHAGMVNRRMTNPVLTGILRIANRFLYQKATRVVVPGRDMKERLERENNISSHRIEVVENWADPAEISPINKEDNAFLRKHIPEEKFVVMYSGNIGLSQDLENVIHTANYLRDKEDMIFLLIGEGALKEELMRLSSSLRLRNLRFLSYQKKKDLKYSLNAADIHLIPLRKGMRGIIVPSKLYGIMAAGKPFIAAVDDGSEADRVVEQFHCGMVIPPSDAQELEKAVLRAFGNRQKIKEMGKRGRQAFENHYTMKICTQKFKRVLQKVM
jgi:glycosyltransferase involved in cell wall biosynthesis